MLSTGLAGSLTRTASAYHEQLGAGGSIGRRGLDYLATRRIDVKVAQEYQLGIVAEPLPGDEAYKGRLAVPYLTPAGVRNIKYRCIEDHDCKEVKHAKYDQPSGISPRLYNVAAYHSDGNVLGWSEGEFDAIAATVHLGIPTIGIPGANMWAKNAPYWKLAADDFDVNIIFSDGDEAGRNAAKQIQADIPAARIVWLPDGEDVNSMVVAGRVDELKKKAGIEGETT